LPHTVDRAAGGSGPLVLLLLTLGGGAAEAQPPSPSPPARPRNVIFILADDHRYDMMGFHPGAPEWLRTPHLDRMRGGGAHLANAFVSTALCSPSRASILTGQYAHRHGVVDNNRDVPPGTRFFPQYLQRAGYRTAFFGKWHMGQDTDEPRLGFDRWVSFRGQGVYEDPVLNVDGRKVEAKGYTSDILTDYAIQWMQDERERSPDRPFFLYLSHKAVHASFVPAPRHRGRYDGARLRYPDTMAADAPHHESWPAWVAAQRSSWHGVDYMYHGRIDYDAFYRRYAETLLGVDDSVGRVLDHLEKSGLDRDTLVVYMGDNGFSFGEHGLIDKRHAFEESMRVPMLAWAPGWIRGGATVGEMVMNLDIMPTILDLAGVSAPADHALDGRSFLSLLEGRKVAWRDDVLYEYYWEWNFPQTPTQFALRTDRYKYVHFYGLWDQDGFYDLQADPGETSNLIQSAEHQERIDGLRARLFERLEASGGLQIPLRAPKGERLDKRRGAGEPSTDPLVKARAN
jgi:N-acetylglucosamine-6-sulfatase